MSTGIKSIENRKPFADIHRFFIEGNKIKVDGVICCCADIDDLLHYDSMRNVRQFIEIFCDFSSISSFCIMDELLLSDLEGCGRNVEMT